jgi:predicted RNase H-like HicB family nuclease
MRYAIVVEKAENNYSAYLSDLPDCVATAKTIDELKVLMRETIELHIEGMIEDACLFLSRTARSNTLR